MSKPPTNAVDRFPANAKRAARAVARARELDELLHDARDISPETGALAIRAARPRPRCAPWQT